MLFDERYGTKRSAHWQRRSGEGKAVHAALERRVRTPRQSRRPSMLMLALLLLAVLAVWLLAPSSRGEDLDQLLPEELKGAELWQSETSLVRKTPVHIRGRPDEVWVKDGRRHLIETKSRSGGVFEGDRMQMAAYAYLLRETDGPPLAPYGYIRFTGEGVGFAKVKLRPDDAVIEAHRRVQSVRAGKAEPRLAKTAAICAGCGHLYRCPAPKTERLS
jgi:hypothetical protein